MIWSSSRRRHASICAAARSERTGQGISRYARSDITPFERQSARCKDHPLRRMSDEAAVRRRQVPEGTSTPPGTYLAAACGAGNIGRRPLSHRGARPRPVAAVRPVRRPTTTRARRQPLVTMPGARRPYVSSSHEGARSLLRGTPAGDDGRPLGSGHRADGQFRGGCCDARQPLGCHQQRPRSAQDVPLGIIDFQLP